jgi:hypothetical protein
MADHLADARRIFSTPTPSSLAAEPAIPEQLSLFDALPEAPEGDELYVAMDKGRIGKSATMPFQNIPRPNSGAQHHAQVSLRCLHGHRNASACQHELDDTVRASMKVRAVVRRHALSLCFLRR